jgi:hypothetical protein
VTCAAGVVAGELVGLARCDADGRADVAVPWVAEAHPPTAKAKTGASSRIASVVIVARGFYERQRVESTRRVLMFPGGRASIGREGRQPARRCCLISYPWTRVPNDAPPLDAWQLRLLPVADRFMALMWSRPGGLSLRTTWVTPATIWLAVVVVIAVGLPGLGAVVYGIANRQILIAVGGLLGAILGAGAATVAVYGIRQRRLS